VPPWGPTIVPCLSYGGKDSTRAPSNNQIAVASAVPNCTCARETLFECAFLIVERPAAVATGKRLLHFFSYLERT